MSANTSWAGPEEFAPQAGQASTSRIVEVFEDGAHRVAVVEPGRRFDATESQHLRELIDGLLQAGMTRLVVDLWDTDFVDSAGLACLVRAMTSLRRAGGDIALVRPEREDTWRVFRLTQFDEVFPLIPSFRG